MSGVSLRCPSVLQQPPSFLSQTLFVCPTPFNETHQSPSSIRQWGPPHTAISNWAGLGEGQDLGRL